MTSKEALELIVRKHCVSNTDEEDEELEKCYEIVKQELKVPEILKNILDNNVLYRVFPYKMVHEFEKFLKSDKALKEWLEK